MKKHLNKNTLLPILIIIVSVIISGLILFSWKDIGITQTFVVASNETLRTLELSVPDMSCVGCTSSVEGYVSSMEGVKQVKARLTPTKSATVIYNPDIVTKEKIIKNQVFDLYGVSIISDDLFDGSLSTTN